MTRSVQLIVSVVSSLGVGNALRCPKDRVHASGEASNNASLIRT